VDARDPHVGLAFEQTRVATQVARLGLVVCLAAKLAFGLLDHRAEVDVTRQDFCDAQRRREVVDVAFDAARDTRVLDLERQLAAV